MYEKSTVPGIPSQGAYFAVQNRKAETLVPLIMSIIRPGSTIYSDEWKAYQRLGQLGYVHKTVCHKKEFITPDGVHTNGIEGAWSRVRKTFPSHGVKKTFVQEYLWEFQYRSNSIPTFQEFAQLVMIHTEENYQRLIEKFDSLDEPESDSEQPAPTTHADDEEDDDSSSIGAGDGESASEYVD